MAIPQLEVCIRLHEDKTERPTKLRAFAELMIGESFVIRSIRIMEHTDRGKHEMFIVFPAEKKKGSDRWYDVAHPCTAIARATATQTILDAYAKAMEIKK